MSHNYSNPLYAVAATDKPVELADGANVAVDSLDGDFYNLVGGALGTRQLDNPTNLNSTHRRVLIFRFVHGGVEALTFDSLYDFGDAGAPTYPANNQYDIITAIWDGAKLDCAYVQGYVSGT